MRKTNTAVMGLACPSGKIEVATQHPWSQLQLTIYREDVWNSTPPTPLLHYMPHTHWVHITTCLTW